MLKYELKKIIFRKELLFFTVFLMLFNTLNIIKNNYKTDVEYDAYLNIYELIRGKEPKECIDILESLDFTGNNNEFLYEQVKIDMINDIMSLSNYSVDCNEITSQCNERALEFINNKYLYNKNIRLADCYANRLLTEYRNVNKIPELIKYKFHYLLIIILIILYASNLFSGEKEINIYMNIKTTKRGNSEIIWYKVAALFLFILTESLLFFMDNLLSFYFCYKFDGLNMPVYQIAGYRSLIFNTPDTDPIIIFILKMFAEATICLFVIGLLVCFLSVVFSSGKITFWISLALVGLLIYIRAFQYVGTGQIINLLNPVSGLITEKWALYLKTENINGIVVNDIYILLVNVAVELLGILSGIYIIYTGVFKKNGKCF